MSAVYGFNGGFPSVLLHHFLYFEGQGCGDVGRWFRLRSGCRTVKKNEHSTALPPRITRIARITILVIREIRGGKTREIRGDEKWALDSAAGEKKAPAGMPRLETRESMKRKALCRAAFEWFFGNGDSLDAVALVVTGAVVSVAWNVGVEGVAPVTAEEVEALPELLRGDVAEFAAVDAGLIALKHYGTLYGFAQACA